MKKRSYKLIIPLVVVLGAVAGWVSCTKKDSKDAALGALPKAAFTITPVSGKTNTWLLTSTSANVFIYRWDIGDGSAAVNGAATDTAYYGQKGTYTVQLMVLGHGGYDTLSQIITVEADDPNGCFGAKQMLTDCSSKTWTLAPIAGALWIGPSDQSSTWWANSAGDVTARACEFNDEWTFSKDGTFTFDNQGDTWVDSDNTNPWPSDIVNGTAGCYDWSAINTKYAAWGNGTHNFQVIGNSKIKVSGLGGYLGLYKVGDTNTTDAPVDGITYDIVSISDTKLVVKKDLGWGAWIFTMQAK
jgi:hypothetical protein